MTRALAQSVAAGYATAGMLPLLLAVLAHTGAAEESLLRRMAAGDAMALRQLYERVGAAPGAKSKNRRRISGSGTRQWSS